MNGFCLSSIYFLICCCSRFKEIRHHENLHETAHNTTDYSLESPNNSMRLRTPLTLVGSLLAAPHLATAAIQNLRFFGVWLSPGHDVPILRVRPLPPSSHLQPHHLLLAPVPSPSPPSLCAPEILTDDGAQFESTITIPLASASSLADNIQAMWPGLEPSDSNGVFQNVVTNQVSHPAHTASLIQISSPSLLIT